MALSTWFQWARLLGVTDGCRVGFREILVYVTMQQHAHELTGSLVVHEIQVLHGMQMVGRGYLFSFFLFGLLDWVVGGQQLAAI